MKNKCDYYCIRKERRYKYYLTLGEAIGYDVEVGVCSGTKEEDQCSCGGDETKCDFYPEVRKKARQKNRAKSEHKEIIGLLIKAIERVTVNTYTEQGKAGADEVFALLQEAKQKIEKLEVK